MGCLSELAAFFAALSLGFRFFFVDFCGAFA
jgi:hypothetical protein